MPSAPWPDPCTAASDEPTPLTSARQRLGAQVHQLRQAAGLSLAQLAASANSSAPTLSQLENARHYPSEALLHRLESALEAPGVLISLYEELREQKRQDELRRRRDPTQQTSGQLADCDRELRPVLGDASEFIADLTIPDGTLMAPSWHFTKTWRIRNSGVVTWTDRHLLRQGPPATVGQITSPRRIPIPTTVPGQIVDLTVPCTAHTLAGTSTAHFKMADQYDRLYFPDRYRLGLRLEVVVFEPSEVFGGDGYGQHQPGARWPAP